MSEKLGNGNRVSDVSLENGYIHPEKKGIIGIGNKVSDNNSTVTVNSADSCTKLTMEETKRKCGGDSLGLALLKLLVSIACGIFFGIAMEKGRGEYSRL